MTTAPRQTPRDAMMVLLKKSKCKIVYTKVDGTSQTRNGTLMEDLIPMEGHFQLDTSNHDEYIKKPENLSIVPYWDLDKMGWRSFRVENLVELYVDEETSS